VDEHRKETQWNSLLQIERKVTLKSNYWKHVLNYNICSKTTIRYHSLNQPDESLAVQENSSQTE
jgi:hypothetical protein